MNAKRWTLVVAISLAAGAVWATGYADWGMSWIDHLPRPLPAIVMTLPLSTMLVCALLLDWWRWQEGLAYGAINVVLGAAGIVRDEKLFGCSCCAAQPLFSSITGSIFCALAFGGPLLAAAWVLGRLARETWRSQ